MTYKMNNQIDNDQNKKDNSSEQTDIKNSSAQGEIKSEKFKSKIGGQALIEGIMMRGIDRSAMALRLPNGEIEVEEWNANNGKNAPWYKKAPFIRGIFNMAGSLVEGYKCLSKSADRAMDFEDEDEEPQSKFEIWLENKIGDKLVPIITTVGSVLGVLVALFLFMWVPSVIVNGLGKLISMNSIVKTLIEGIIKIFVFVGYMALTGLMKDIRRTYQYHGAEHKTIACYEAGDELTPESVKKYTRFHPRCGTSFIFIVLFISIIVFSVFRLPWSNVFLRFICKLPLLPVIVGVGYEIIRLAGKYNNTFTRIISAPGLWLQRLTTREPDLDVIEVAIAALKPCIPKDSVDDRW